MLARIEEAYLTILRVAIVCVAGLALLLALGGAIAGTIYFVKGVGSSASGTARGGDLSEFMAQKKLATGFGTTASDLSTVDQANQQTAVSPAIDEAATILTAYLNKQREGTVSKSDMLRALDGLRAEIGIESVPEYDESLRRLVGQLEGSKGKPLSSVQVGEMIQWHHDGFETSLQERQTSAASDAASGWAWLVRGGQAFLLFTAIAFYFLLVRIERHLKLVRVEHQTRPNDPVPISNPE